MLYEKITRDVLIELRGLHHQFFAEDVHNVHIKPLQIPKHRNWHDLFDEAPVLYCTATSELIIQKANKKAIEVLGENLIGRNLLDFFPETTNGKV
ncbi:hypothetical protein WDW89_11610 [Deltaproteobacteria bacterium TL4]